MIRVLLLFLYLDAIGGVYSGEAPQNVAHESQLLDHLFDIQRYDKRVRPVTHPSTAVNVSLVLDLYQIITVDGKSQSISLFCWVYEYWDDNRLHWKPEDYGDLDQLSLAYNSVWTPDTTLINNIQMDTAQVEHRQSVIIDLLPNNRTQMFFPRTAQYTVGCLFDVQFFPFDVQNCTLTFASWAHDVTKIDYVLPNTQTTFEAYQESDEWSVESFDIRKRLIHYDCCARPYQMIFAHLVIRRKPLYYVVNLVLPTFIISLISSVGLFANPRNAGKEEKVNLGITTLLALSILLLTVSDQIPKGSSSVPLLGWFYLAIMFHLSLETLLAVYMSQPKNEKRMAAALLFCKSKFSYRPKPPPQETLLHESKRGDESENINHEKSIRNEAPLKAMRPGTACMICNVIITVLITLVAFIGGVVKIASHGYKLN